MATLLSEWEIFSHFILFSTFILVTSAWKNLPFFFFCECRFYISPVKDTKSSLVLYNTNKSVQHSINLIMDKEKDVSVTITLNLKSVLHSQETSKNKKIKIFFSLLSWDRRISNVFIYLFIYFILWLWVVCLHEYMCLTCIFDTQGSQKRASYTPVLE